MAVNLAEVVRALPLAAVTAIGILLAVVLVLGVAGGIAYYLMIAFFRLFPGFLPQIPVVPDNNTKEEHKRP